MDLVEVTIVLLCQKKYQNAIMVYHLLFWKLSCNHACSKNPRWTQ